ncbi:MAG: hypothetical protein ACYDHF_00490 [Candidatus Cryosericum sp.]
MGVSRKAVKAIKWFLVLSLIFSSLFLFNYAYFKGNNGMFYLNALDSDGGSIRKLGFDVNSLPGIAFGALRYGGEVFGRLRCPYYEYRKPYTDPTYFDNGSRTGAWIDLWYANLANSPANPNGKLFLRGNSAIVFYYVMTPDDDKILDTFQNTTMVPYPKSVYLQIKTLPTMVGGEFFSFQTDQDIALELPFSALTTLLSIPYLCLQIVVPPSLSIPFFWLYLLLSVLYVVLPQTAWERMKTAVNAACGKLRKNETRERDTATQPGIWTSARAKRATRFIAIGLVALLLVSVGWYFVAHSLTFPYEEPPKEGVVGLTFGIDMATQIKNNEEPYVKNIPDFVLTGTGSYTTDVSATVKITAIQDTRTLYGEITSLTDLRRGNGMHNSVQLYLCQPISSQAMKHEDGTIVYSGTGYPDIVAGKSYDVVGIVQKPWYDYPVVYVPVAADFRATTQQTTVPAEDALKEFLKYWNEKNLPEMEKRISPDVVSREWRLDELNYVKVISITEREPTEAETMAFVVVLNINYVKSHGKMIGWENGEAAYDFSLKRITDTSPWLVAGIWRGDP